jgi:hypothetical protein
MAESGPVVATTGEACAEIQTTRNPKIHPDRDSIM